MKAAVITPYYKEDIAILRRCHLSVLDQDVACRHFMVADGFPSEIVAGWDCEHITLSKPHGDTGNTPRAIGCLSAVSQGFEIIFLLDADNWYCSDHVSEGIRLRQDNPSAAIGALRRNIVLPDGTPVPDSAEDENKTHIDTTCYAFFESSFSILPLWGLMPTFLGAIGDRIIFASAKSRNMNIVWSSKKTCFYTSNYRSSYLLANRKPPLTTNDCDFNQINSLIAANQSLIQARIGISIGSKSQA